MFDAEELAVIQTMIWMIARLDIAWSAIGSAALERIEQKIDIDNNDRVASRVQEMLDSQDLI